jgi:predicted DsbA family dithiol-disulfide isomerase
MQQFAQRMRVEALPTFLLLKGYKVMARVVGVDMQELEKSIEKNKNRQADGSDLQTVDPEEDIDKNPTILSWAWFKSLLF